MAYSSFDINLRLNVMLLKKAIAEHDSRRITEEEMKTFIRRENYMLGQDKKLVSDVFKAYEESLREVNAN